MIKNYFKIAWRNIQNRKFYSLINIFGLTIAITSSLLIYLYISYNLSFDTYHKDYQLIYRVVYELHLDKTEYEKGGSIAIYNKLKSESSQVHQAALKIDNQSYIVNVEANGEKRFKEDKNISFIDANWFDVFKYNFLEGGYQQLSEPNTAVLSQKIATKYFGNLNPIRHSFFINKQAFKVVGVVSDRPYQSDLKSDIYLSYSSFKNLNPEVEDRFFTGWGNLWSAIGVYVKLNNKVERTAIEKELALITKDKFGEEGAKYYNFKLLPLKDIHFSANYGGVVQKSLFGTLAFIGFLIIIIACINYINLMLAKQARKAVDIGTRKVFGASGKQLFTQFMVESLLNCAIALIVALILASFLLPLINQNFFSDAPIYVSSYQSLFLAVFLVLIAISTVSGLYPGLVLSRLNVLQVMKSKTTKFKGAFSRRVLIIFQNVIAQSLIAGTIIIVLQVNFLKNTDKGFNRESVIMIPLGESSDAQKSELTQELSHIPSVQSFSFCNNPPSSNSQRGATVKFAERPDWEKWPARFAIGDTAYCKTFGLHIIAGRNIRSSSFQSEFLINEKMLKALNVDNVNDVLGKDLMAGDSKGIIVGVVKDFNVKSLIEPIEPSVFLETKKLESNLAVKLSGENPQSALSSIQKIYQDVFPTQVFSYQFLDDEIASLYKKEILQQKMIWTASVIAVFICAIGLLGLISLITLQRTKEIGIRKTLGASVFQIGTVLTKEFIFMICIAFVVACPLCYWLMNKWLQNFAYKIEISWWIFAVAGVLSLGIAFITISFQTVKAALANPIKSLRTE